MESLKKKKSFKTFSPIYLGKGAYGGGSGETSQRRRYHWILLCGGGKLRLPPIGKGEKNRQGEASPQDLR